MSERWVIGEGERDQRRRNNGLGLALSLLLVAIIVYQNHNYPAQYNDVLLWSVVGFVIAANLISYYRFRRYLKRSAGHFLELADGQLRFSTAGEVSSLELNQIAAMRVFRRGARVSHVQLLLTTNRGIRLEGYEEMEGLVAALTRRLPADKIMAG